MADQASNSVRIKAPDGSFVDFPAGTPDAEMETAMRTHFGGPEKTSGEDIYRSLGQAATHDLPSMAGLYGEALDAGGAFEGLFDPGSADRLAARRKAYKSMGLWDYSGMVPDSASISSAIDKVIPSYHSQTEAGQLVETIGDYLPAALSPGKAFTKAVRVLGPALASEGAGHQFKGTDLEPLARVVGGVAGGGLTEGLRGVLTRWGSTPDERALRFISQAMRNAGVTPADMLKTAAQMEKEGGSVEEMFFQLLGRPGITLARALANVPGKAMTIAENAFDARKAGVTDRVTKEAVKATGVKGGDAPADFITNLRTKGQEAIKAKYTAADTIGAKVPVKPGDVAGLGKNVRDALYNAGGVPPPGATGAAAIPFVVLPDDTTLPSMQHALRTVDKFETLAETGKLNRRVAEQYRTSLTAIKKDARTNTDQRAVDKIISEFDKAVDRIGDTPSGSNPVTAAYRQAREGYGENKDQEEFIEAGRKAFDTDDFELGLMLKGKGGKGLAPHERDGFMVGVMRAITEKLNAGDTRFVQRLDRDKNLRNSLAKALGGADKARRFFARASREALMAREDNVIRAGARSTPMAEDIKNLTIGEDEFGFIADLAKNGGNVKPIALKWLSQAIDRGRRPGIYNPEVNEALGKRVFDKATVPRVKGTLDALRNSKLQKTLQQVFPGYVPLSVSQLNPRQSNASAKYASDDELLKTIGAK